MPKAVYLINGILQMSRGQVRAALGHFDVAVPNYLLHPCQPAPGITS
jgi:hypothetical protein